MKPFLWVVTALVGLIVSQCGGENSGTTVTARLKTSGVSLVAVARSLVGDVGHTSTSQLVSLQYFVTRINICEDLTISGSGYSGSINCVAVYTDSEGGMDNAYNTYKVSQAEADTSANWIDVMSADSLAAVGGAAVTITPGTYRYGIIEHRMPVKLNASVVVPRNSVELKTCSGGTVSDVVAGDWVGGTTQKTTVSDMTSCTQSLVTLGGQGGGKWFRFSQPFVVEEGKQYELDLAFDPEGAVTGGVEATGGWGHPAYVDGTYVLSLPALSLVGVVRESGTQHTIREQYELSGLTGVAGTIILNLYYAGQTSDVGTATIVGASTRFINSSSADQPGQVAAPYSVVTNLDGTITVKDWQDAVIVDGLRRSALATVGSTGTAVVNTGSVAGQAASSVSATVTFNGLTEM